MTATNEQADFIILSIQEYREKDALVQALQANGKLTLVARGFTKPNSKQAGMIQPYMLSHILYRHQEQRSLASLTSAQCIQSNRLIRDDLFASTVAAIMCEVIEKGTLGQEESYFELLKTCLASLDALQSPYGVLCFFLALYLRSQGIYPEVDTCVRCQHNPHIFGISVSDGGFVCHSCFTAEHDIKRTKEQLKKFRLVNRAQLIHLSIVLSSATWDYADAQGMLAFVKEHGGLQLKSMQFLEDIANLS